MHEFRHRAAAALRRVGADGDASDLDIRVLRRVDRLDDFPLTPHGEGPFRKIAIVDTETTGTDPDRDEIIDIAVVTVEIDPAGRVVGITNAAQALRDPGLPIPPVISKITGLTDADVAGKHIDLDRLERRLAAADVRIAHNASFDIAFVERLLPGLAGAAWACSCTEVDWLDLGFDGRALGYLLTQVGRFNTGHRAMSDVNSLLHLLSQELDNGMTILGRLLERAALPTLRIEATGAGFDKRSALKSRGYRWDPRGKVWWLEVEPADLDEEVAWLGREAGVWGTPRTRPITWHERHR